MKAAIRQNRQDISAEAYRRVLPGGSREHCNATGQRQKRVECAAS